MSVSGPGSLRDEEDRMRTRGRPWPKKNASKSFAKGKGDTTTQHETPRVIVSTRGDTCKGGTGGATRAGRRSDAPAIGSSRGLRPPSMAKDRSARLSYQRVANDQAPGVSGAAARGGR